MQRVRRDSASSTDSWSIIEQKLSSREASSEELLNSDECGSDSDIEIAEEAFDSDDSQDSDIEVDSQRDEDEEDDGHESETESEEIDEEEEKIEEENEVEDEVEENETQDEEDDEEEDVEDEEDDDEDEEQDTVPGDDDTPEWGLVSQKEAMSGEGKHFVVPEKIRSRLDNMVEKRHNSLNVALFLKISLACFIIQNVAVFCSLLLAKPIYHQPEIRSYRPVTLYKRQPVDSSVFRPLVYNNSASLQCWSPRAAEVQKKTAVIEKGLSWENITLIATNKCWFQKTVTSFSKGPKGPKKPEPSTYGRTTVSKPRSLPEVCKRKEKPPTVPKTLYPCKQVSPMPTPPKRKEPMSPLSAIKDIMYKKVERVFKPVEMTPKAKQVEEPLRGPLFRTAAKPKPSLKPRGRSFNYKMEFTPAPKVQEKQKVNSKRGPQELMVISTERKVTKMRKMGTFKPVKMDIKQKKRYSAKASQLMRNASYVGDRQQCKREEFSQFKKRYLEDKTRRSRRRLVEYKIEKPCRAIYEEKKMAKKVAKTMKKIDKLEAKIQKKINRIEKKIQKRSQYPLSI